MKPVTIKPVWYLWWSPKAWKLARQQEAVLNWWLKLPTTEKMIEEALWKDINGS